MKAKKAVAQAYLWLILLILYAPIIFIAVFSFTTAKSLGNWTGFTFELYRNLFTGAMLWICVIASILINGISLISRKGSPSYE